MNYIYWYIFIKTIYRFIHTHIVVWIHTHLYLYVHLCIQHIHMNTQVVEAFSVFTAVNGVVVQNNNLDISTWLQAPPPHSGCHKINSVLAETQDTSDSLLLFWITTHPKCNMF